MTTTTDPAPGVAAPDFTGRMMDVDSHEMIAGKFWPEEFGDIGAELRPLSGGVLGNAGDNTLFQDIEGDVMEITPEIVRNHKGPAAPGALDFNRRTEVLDALGIDRQVVFPGFGLLGLTLIYNETLARDFFDYDPANFDHLAVGRRVIEAHNAWAARTAKLDPVRVRPVGVLLTDSIPQIMADAEAALAAGVPALWIAGSRPPAGASPAATALDPFWRLMAEANAPVMLHIGTERGFLKDNRWGDGVPQFTPAEQSTLEFTIEPYRAGTLHLQCDNFLTAMVLGGVFERHPELRFGVMELGAYWIGPLGDQLDIIANEFSRRLSGYLSMPPSEYLARNVRVTPFYFEPVDEYFEKYPKMESVYCYSSDYPHVEGGKDAAARHYAKLLRLGDDVAETFFVTNGEWLLPDING